MPRVHVVENSSASPESVLEAARDMSPRRAELWRDVYVEHMTVHGLGETWADVTEGNPWPVVGVVWERLRYDWSEPGTLRGTVIDSNIFRPGSTWEIRASPSPTGSRVEIGAGRHLKGRGWKVDGSSPSIRLTETRVEAADQAAFQRGQGGRADRPAERPGANG